MTLPSPVREARPPAEALRGERAAVAVGAVVLVIGTFLQAPGKILPETKLDLLIEPGRFLSRAVSLWDPSQSFGQIQNQAAGYLLPMGPLYWLGRTVGLPPWVVQRLWIGGLLAVGFWGVARLARALDIGTPAARVVGAGAYVLGAASLTLVAFRSGTQVPVYALPWVLAPLVEADRHGHRRAAALSGLAVALMGGVNGTATLLVLAVPVIWFLTRAPAPGRWRLAAWWGAAVVAATTWWVVPLALQGRYGYAFTGYTESATLTTAVSSATEVLRGTGNWLAYLTSQDRLWLPGGWELIANRAAILGGLAVSATGLAGLSRRDLPERRWLALTALAGAVVMVAGYRGPLGSPFWSTTRSLLDGALVPLRNVHKVQPVLALPVVLGATHLLGTAHRWVAARWTARGEAGMGEEGAPSERSSPRRPPLATLGIAAVIVVGAVAVAAGGLPFLHGRTGADGTFAEVPGYWRQAGAWLDAHAQGRRSIVLPASSFGEYTWGRPLDDPLASTTDQPLAVRDIVPLGSNGTTRLLDGIEAQLQSGRLDEGLTSVLRRSGVQYLLVRNDLDPDRTNALPPGQIRSLLAERLGGPVASFGPLVDARLDAAHLRPRRSPARVRAVEVWSLGAAMLADTYLAGQALMVSGEPEALYDLSTAGVLADRGTVLAGDPEAPALREPGSGAAVSDRSRLRDVAFGDVRFDASYTLTPTKPAPGTERPPSDRLVVPGTGHLASARLEGAATVRASSYGKTDLLREPADQPWAAFDGDPTTSWRPSLGAPSSLNNTVGSWLEVDLDRPRDLRRLTVTVPTGRLQSQADTITVTTDRGSVVARPGNGTATVELPPGATRKVRLGLDQVQFGAKELGAPGITDVAIPGLGLARPVATPPAGADVRATGGDLDLVLSRAHGDPFARDPSPEDSALDRSVSVDRRTTLAVKGTAVARPGPALDDLLGGLRTAGRPPLRVEASSTWNGQPAFGPARAVDGDPATGWVAADTDASPTITLSWDGERTLDSLTVAPLGSPATRVDALVITSVSGESRTVAMPRSPTTTVRFEPLRTDRVTIRLGRTQGGQLLNAAAPGEATGLAEVRFDALADLGSPAVDPATPFMLACGHGPTVRVGTTVMDTRLQGTVGDLLEGRPIPFEVCGAGAVTIGGGTTRITSGIDGPLQAETLRLTAAGDGRTGSTGSATRATTVLRWDDEHRLIRVRAGGRGLLALTENANPGWEATLGGRRLQPTRVDGWRQAWVVPAGSGGTISIDFAPGGGYRVSLALGFALLVVLAGAAAVPVGRRRRRPAPGLRPVDAIPLPVAFVIVGLVGLVAGGWAVLLAVPLLLLPRRSEMLPGLVAAAAAGATVVVLMTPGGLPQDQNGTFSAAAQGLSVLALVALAVSLLDGDHLRRSLPARRGRFPRRPGTKPPPN